MYKSFHIEEKIGTKDVQKMYVLPKIGPAKDVPPACTLTDLEDPHRMYARAVRLEKD